MKKKMDKLKIHIIGGTGQMGNWFRNFLESQKLSCSVSDEKNQEPDLIKNADLIFISVPISQAPKVIKSTATIAKKGCILIDFSSSMMQSSQALKETKLSGACLHFLFGPSVSSIQNQKIVLNVVKNNFVINSLKKALIDNGAHIIEMNPKDHDFQMAHIQILTHFINISIAQTLIADKIDLTGKISTPIFLNQLSTLTRVLSQSPNLITELQTTNIFSNLVLKKVINSQKKLFGLIRNKKQKKLNNIFANLHKKIAPVKQSSNHKIINQKIKLKSQEKIAFLGPKGTFSYQAATLISGKNDRSLIAKNSFYEVFKAIRSNTADYGIVPAENSTEGTIRETLDFLIDFDLKTNFSVELAVHQSLLSNEKKLSKVDQIISHPQALAQCRNWLEQNLPKANIETASSTISKINELKDKKGVAFIGSEAGSKLYGVNVLARNIEDNKNNITKFYLVSKSLTNLANTSNKTLLFLTIYNRVGILRDILSIFADSGINLNKIESRPSKEKVWDYYFFIEVDVSLNDERLSQALNILKQYCPVIKILGGV